MFDNLISYVLFVTMLGYIHTMATMTTAKNSEQKEPVRSAIPEHTVMAIVLVATIILIYAVNAKGFLANRALIQGMTPKKRGWKKILNISRRRSRTIHLALRKCANISCKPRDALSLPARLKT